MNRFPKAHRIQSKSDFDLVFQNGEKFVCQSFIALTVGSPHTYPRLGVIVSKKIGNAVVRNKVKRSFREIFRQLPYHEKMSQRDFVIVARREVKKLHYRELSLAVSKSIQWFERKLG